MLLMDREINTLQDGYASLYVSLAKSKLFKVDVKGDIISRFLYMVVS